MSNHFFSVMGFATILACFGIKDAFDGHSAKDKDSNLAPIPHAYSLHSWCGILTIVLAVAQVLFAFMTLQSNFNTESRNTTKLFNKTTQLEFDNSFMNHREGY